MFFTIPTAVELSMWIGMGGCVCPSSDKINRTTFDSCMLRKYTPSSASAADAATNLRVSHVNKLFPLSLIGFPSTGRLPRKKYPPAQLRTFAAER